MIDKSVYAKFNRLDGMLKPPKDTRFFNSLRKAPRKILSQIGLFEWSDGFWLYPVDWYGSIPDQYPIVTIDGFEEPFEHGVFGKYTICGYLPFGFIDDRKYKDMIKTMMHEILLSYHA